MRAVRLGKCGCNVRSDASRGVMVEQSKQTPGLLSVCIPVYNFTVVDTVGRFLAEADRQSLNVEIVIFDDCSDPFYAQKNATLAEYSRVRYLPLVENMGRSRIRNRLADYANGEWLLFLDCDMEPIYTNFLSRYFSAMSDQVDVVCGGVSFGSKPHDKQMQLRWKHEMRWVRQREVLQLHDPALRVEVGNFMIRRELYGRCGFDENLTGYGQEDRVFVYRLSQMRARVQFIDNPTNHLGQERNEVFLRKVEESTVNMVRVWNANPEMHASMLRGNRRLLFVVTLQRMRLLWALLLSFRVSKKMLRRRLERGYSWLSSLRYYQTCCIAEAFVKPNLNMYRGTRRLRR